MKRLLLILVLVLMVSCTSNSDQEMTNLLEFHEEIVELDARYNTSYKEEMINLLLIRSEGISNYLEDLEELEEDFAPENERQDRWMGWLYEARKQMLQAQSIFQQAILGIGQQGRVMDGFKCSEFPQIEEFAHLTEKAWSLGINSTRIFDSLLTESTEARELIGIGEESPRLYDSDFKGMYNEVHDNVFAMHSLCNRTIETEYMEFDINNTNSTGIGGVINGT